MIYAHISDEHIENLVNMIPETDLVTNLETKQKKRNPILAKLPKKMEWAIQVKIRLFSPIEQES